MRDDTKITLLRRALEHQPRSAKFMFSLADLLADNGGYDEYARLFRQACKIDPKAQPLLDLRSPAAVADRAPRLRNKAEALVERGVCYSSVIAALAISSASLGDKETVQRLIDYDRFFSVTANVVPQEFDERRFFATLANEIKSNLEFYDTRDGKSIQKAWRHNNVLHSDGPACRAIAQEIRARVGRYISGLVADTSHPFLASVPAKFNIEGWAVISGGEGHHKPHIHPRAWASGVYYVVRPAISRDANGHRGWLRVGPPPPLDGISSSAGWSTRMIAPEPGTLVLMPAYFFHDTEPLDIEQERICIAFDVEPVELEF